MLKYKNIWIILIAVLVVLTVISVYLVRGATTAKVVSGYIVLMDQKVLTSEFSQLGVKNFESIIYLPSGDGEGSVTSCSFTFPTSADEIADVTKDGKVDAADVYLASLSYGCRKEDPNGCWEQTFNIQECYFVYSDLQFKDPNRDCKIDINDVNSASKCYGQITSPFSTTCEDTECCRADISKDGKVDVIDVALLASKLDSYANVYKNYASLKKKDLDITGPTPGVPDGRVDVRDVAIVAKNYGQTASEQKCRTNPLENIGENKWKVSVSGRGLHYIGVSYRILAI